MKKYFILSFFLLLVLFIPLSGQITPQDTSVVIRSYQINANFLSRDSVKYDTSFYAVHQYNPMYYQSFSNTFLGNTGQPALTNNIMQRQNHPDFIFADPYKFYSYTPYNIYHFNTRKPYTEIKYLSSGSRDDSEQVLSALHTQNVNPFVNIGVLYDLIASRGIYDNQNTTLNRLNLFGSLQKENYSMHTSLHYNGFRFEENGGISDLNQFLNRESDAFNYATNLNDANSKYRNLTLFLTQKIELPALFSDSINKITFSNFSLNHNLLYERYSRNYTDIVPSVDSLRFYDNNYYLNQDVYDSAFYQNLTNRVDLNINFAKTQNLNAYFKHEYKTFRYARPENVSYTSDSVVIDTVIRSFPENLYHDLSVGGTYLGELENWNYSARAYLYFTGYRAGDFLLEGRFTRFFRQKTLKLTLGGKQLNTRPSYFLNQYASANFIWNQEFRNIDLTQAYLNLQKMDDFHLKIALNLYKDYVFFNENGLPEQNENEIFTATIWLHKHFKWGSVNHTHDVLLQKAADEFINVPLLAYNNSTWYQNALFKKVLKFRLGVNFYYFTEYYANGFMPSTGMFYNQKLQQVGNYPFLTAFLDLKLKRTRFTLQYTNALAELMPEASYFMAYQYPNFNGSFKFGLAWTFYD